MYKPLWSCEILLDYPNNLTLQLIYTFAHNHIMIDSHPFSVLAHFMADEIGL